MPHIDMAVYASPPSTRRGNEGTRTPHLGRSPPDIDLIAPTAPKSLQAKALTKRRVRLTWPAATDDLGVIRYDVVVRGPGRAEDDSRRTVTIRLAGKRGKRVTIAVRAVDAAGNRSKLVKVLVRLR